MIDRPAWQFRLSDLFALTTLCSIGAAIAAARGPGTLLLTGGVILAFANWRGAFAPLQHGRRQTYLLWLAWCLFLLSLVLPSIRIFGPVAGWGAAWLAIAAPLEGLWSAEIEVENPCYLLWHEGINLANGLMLLMPV